MNPNIHNKEVANFQIEVTNFENALIKGEKLANDLNAFNTIFQELKGLIDDYKKLYLETNDQNRRQDYEKYLEGEIDFLNLLNEIMTNLDHYHDVVGFVDGHEIQIEWEQARLIMIYRNVERQIATFNRMHKTSDSMYQEQYQMLIKKYEMMRKKVIDAEAYIIEKSSTAYNTMEVGNSTDKRQNFYTLDYSFFINLPLITDKIQYIELLLQNIAQVKGKKSSVQYNGMTKEIATKYVSRYRQYVSILNHLYKEYEAEENHIINRVGPKEKMDVYASQYANLVIAFYKLGKEASQANEVEIVDNIDGGPLTILKTRVDKYKEMDEKYQNMTAEIPYMDSSKPYFLAQNVAGYKNLTSAKFDLYNKLKFLEDHEEKLADSEAEKERIQQEFYDYVIAERFANVACMKVLFKSCGLDEDLCSLYTSIVVDGEEFIKTDDYSKEQKEEYLTDIIEKILKFNKIKDQENNLNISIPLLEGKESTFLVKQLGKVKNTLASLPLHKKCVRKVEVFKNTKNRNALRNRIKENSGSFTVRLGMEVFAYGSSIVVPTTTMVRPKPKIIKRKIEEIEVPEFIYEPEEERDAIGEMITNIANRYQESREERIRQVDIPKFVYTLEEDEPEVLVYDYNGTYIELSKNSPDFKAKKSALEANGAILVTDRDEERKVA